MYGINPFHNNQVFDVSCQLDELADVIRLAVKLANKEDMFTRKECRVKPAYQVSGKYFAIAAGSMAPGGAHAKGIPASDGWTDMPDYDPEKIAAAVSEWAETKAQLDYRNKQDIGPGTTYVRVRSYFSTVQIDSGHHGLANTHECFLTCEAKT